MASLRSLPAGRWLRVLAFGSLAAAWLAGFLIRAHDTRDELGTRFEGVALEAVPGRRDLFVVRGAEGEQGFVSVNTADGWGGPLSTATWVGGNGRIRQVEVLAHRETPSFFEHVVRRGFFDQFPEKEATAPLRLGHDIDAVSGATVTSAALARAVAQGSHGIAEDRLGLDVPRAPTALEVGRDELVLVLLYVLVLGAVTTRFTRARPVLLAGSLVFLGFVVARPLTLGHLASIALGYVPGIREQLFWWLLVGGTLALTLLLRRNLYCSWMCPFGGLQELVTLIGGVKLRISRRLSSVLRRGVYVLLWAALMITFLTSNPALGAYEPFAVLFSLRGLPIQWYLVSVAIVGSFVVPRFWCRFFCPVGACLNHTARAAQRLVRAAGAFVPGRRQTARTPVPLPVLRPSGSRSQKAA